MQSNQKSVINDNFQSNQQKLIMKQHSVDKKQELYDVMKRIDGLIDGENSICDNTSLSSDVINSVKFLKYDLNN